MFLFVSFMDMLFFAGLLLFAKSLPSLWRLLWQHKKAAGCGLLVCVLAFGTAFLAFRRPTVYFGAFEGKPLCWEVVAESDKTQTLLLKTPLSPRAFDENGSGRWKDSSLRAWLNGPFLEAFSSEEAARLVPAAHKVLLSAQNLEEAAGGSHPHFWTSEPHSVFSLGESAYFEPACDQVRLLSLEEYQNLSFSKAASQPYWLADPYTANNTMVRYSQKGGFVLHQEAANPLYVRPVITINKQ